MPVAPGHPVAVTRLALALVAVPRLRRRWSPQALVVRDGGSAQTVVAAGALLARLRRSGRHGRD